MAFRSNELGNEHMCDIVFRNEQTLRTDMSLGMSNNFLSVEIGFFVRQFRRHHIF